MVRLIQIPLTEETFDALVEQGTINERSRTKVLVSLIDDVNLVGMIVESDEATLVELADDNQLVEEDEVEDEEEDEDE